MQKQKAVAAPRAIAKHAMGMGCSIMLSFRTYQLCYLFFRIGCNVPIDTICITIEDYSTDFVHLRDHFYDTLLHRAQNRLAREYFRALFTPKYVDFFTRLAALKLTVCSEINF